MWELISRDLNWNKSKAPNVAEAMLKITRLLVSYSEGTKAILQANWESLKVMTWAVKETKWLVNSTSRYKVK